MSINTSPNSKITKIGIVGAGRLGTVLAKQLRTRFEILLADKEVEKAELLANDIESTCISIEGLLKTAEVIILSLPSESSVQLVSQKQSIIREKSLLINVATSLSTEDLSRRIDRTDIIVAGLKPITQALALEMGNKTVFVSSCKEPEVQIKLLEIFGPIGKIYWNDEMIVKEINAKATRHGLSMYLNLEKELSAMGINHEWVEVAIKTVAVGTILDFPPKEDNPYIEQRLLELKLEQIGR